MKDGVLQQLDSPKALYDHPANTFVAGFIGSPAMNFFEVAVAKSDAGYRLMAEGIELELSGDAARGLGSVGAGKVTLGVRPESLVLAPEGEIAAVVEVVEALGSEQHVYFNTGAKSFVAKLDASSRLSMGDRVHLKVPAGKIHLFDVATGRSLALDA